MLARVIWLTVGTSALTSSESPAAKSNARKPTDTCFAPCSTRQASGRCTSCISSLGAVARTTSRP